MGCCNAYKDFGAFSNAEKYALSFLHWPLSVSDQVMMALVSLIAVLGVRVRVGEALE